MPVTATVRGGQAPYTVTAPWQGAGTSGTPGLNQNGSVWRGSMTFATPGDYTWRVVVRDATGATAQSGVQTIHVDPCPQ